MLARDHFYTEEGIDNTDFKKDPSYNWTFQSKGLILYNDSLQTIYFSFNGKDIDGSIKPSDKWLSLDKKTETKIWLKTSKAIPMKSAMRIMVWRGEV